jgi:hypothetical protein
VLGPLPLVAAGPTPFKARRRPGRGRRSGANCRFSPVVHHLRKSRTPAGTYCRCSKVFERGNSARRNATGGPAVSADRARRCRALYPRQNDRALCAYRRFACLAAAWVRLKSRQGAAVGFGPQVRGTRCESASSGSAGGSRRGNAAPPAKGARNCARANACGEPTTYPRSTAVVLGLSIAAPFLRRRLRQLQRVRTYLVNARATTNCRSVAELSAKTRCGKCSWHEVFRRVLAKSRRVERHPEQYVPQGLSTDILWPRTGATNRRH